MSMVVLIVVLMGFSFETSWGRGYLTSARITNLQSDDHARNDANDFMQDDDTGFRCACSSDRMASALQG